VSTLSEIVLLFMKMPMGLVHFKNAPIVTIFLEDKNINIIVQDLR